MSGLAVFAVSLLTAPPPEKIPNGNYAAGVVEGLVHVIPETRERIAKAVEKIR